MIAKLSGRVDSTADDWVIIDVGGVGYLAFCSGRTLGALVMGEFVNLHIETHVREDHIHLYGFITVAERNWFRLLTTVQGVGAKVALGILSSLSSDELIQAIAATDKAAISRANGVGPKLAVRILSELKDKVSGLALGQTVLTDGANDLGAKVTNNLKSNHDSQSEIPDAISALVNLGYSPSDALGAVSRAASEMGPEVRLDALIRAGLLLLSPSDQIASQSGRD